MYCLDIRILSIPVSSIAETLKFIYQLFVNVFHRHIFKTVKKLKSDGGKLPMEVNCGNQFVKYVH